MIAYVLDACHGSLGCNNGIVFLYTLMHARAALHTIVTVLCSFMFYMWSAYDKIVSLWRLHAIIIFRLAWKDEVIGAILCASIACTHCIIDSAPNARMFCQRRNYDM